VLSILYEDNHCLAVAKPAGWLTMGDATGDTTLLDAAKDYIKTKYEKPGAVFIGVVHRLDRPVSGVVLYARTSKAASRLSEQFRTHAVEKVYLAAVTGMNIPAAGELHDWLIKDEQTNRSRSVKPQTPGALECRLAFRRLQQSDRGSLLEIRPQTGRSHQIRVQLATRGWPILGDNKYGGTKEFLPHAIGLHASRLAVQHPTTKEPLSITCPLPAGWKSWGFREPRPDV
jgi:23S rRNA pseudouridine1911/1915/1917 synthase